jgi:S-adenosylmethionine hydrolase
VTSTFHGRDIFMPVAAHLAAGTPFATAGDTLDVASLVTLPEPESHVIGGSAHGEVVIVDRFGNVQLSVTAADAALAGIVPGAAVIVAWSGNKRRVPFARTFGEVPPGEVVSYPDSAGFVAIAVNGGSAAQRLELRPGSRVTLTVMT